MVAKKIEPSTSLANKSPWLTEPEAAEYCRCSVWAFRNMHLPAKNSGGRKVYHRDMLDASIQARPWSRGAVVGPVKSTSNATLAERLGGERRRPHKPRKKSQD